MGCYLGFKLRHYGDNRNNYSKLIEKITSKMVGWRNKCLSKAGRITLERTVLNVIPIFQMQLEIFPSHIHRELDKSCRDCIWGDDNHNKKIHMISWENLCKPKEPDGSGFQKAENMNKALLSKLSGECPKRMRRYGQVFLV